MYFLIYMFACNGLTEIRNEIKFKFFTMFNWLTVIADF